MDDMLNETPERKRTPKPLSYRVVYGGVYATSKDINVIR